MSGLANDVVPTTTVGRFADWLLAVDLPQLDDERRDETVRFIEGRAAVLPSITRFGVHLIGFFVRLLGLVLGRERAGRLILRLPLPLLSEYPRLVRSLGYAYVWETWPGTTVEGGAR